MEPRSNWVNKLTIYRITLSKRQQILFTIFLLSLTVLLPLILIILPAGFFDQGESVCLSKLVFDTSCYACGMTRACMHLIHLDFEEAFVYNMGSFIVLPLVSFLWLKWFLSLKTKLRKLVQ
jgi:hypothetical protein